MNCMSWNMSNITKDEIKQYKKTFKVKIQTITQVEWNMDSTIVDTISSTIRANINK